MRIELLWFDGCPNHHAARTLLDEVLAERGVAGPVVSVEVPDLETGRRVRFPGSPTIRVDGVDIEPDFSDASDYTPRCRVYRIDGRFRGVPDRRWIEHAIDAAAG